MEESNPELESFRQQWKAEVSAKARNDGNKGTNSGPSKQHRRPAFNRLASAGPSRISDETDDREEPPRLTSFDGTSKTEGKEKNTQTEKSREPQSALEHYEKAVERETQGSLGDSLDLYRKAFRVS
jgi:F-box protein 9